jgi:hypothetical protein
MIFLDGAKVSTTIPGIVSVLLILNLLLIDKASVGFIPLIP